MAIIALISILITVIHTLDELGSDGGPIWSYLTELSPVTAWVPAWISALGYVLFQSVSIGLAVLCVLGTPWALPVLAGIRVIDVLFTHTVLPRVKSPNPGMATRWLLLWDVAVFVFVG